MITILIVLYYSAGLASLSVMRYLVPTDILSGFLYISLYVAIWPIVLIKEIVISSKVENKSSQV